MTAARQYPNTTAAFEAGVRVGRKEAEEAANHEREPTGPPPLTLANISAGLFSDDELIARRDEVDELLTRESQ